MLATKIAISASHSTHTRPAPTDGRDNRFANRSHADVSRSSFKQVWSLWTNPVAIRHREPQRSWQQVTWPSDQLFAKVRADEVCGHPAELDVNRRAELDEPVFQCCWSQLRHREIL